MRTTKKPTKLIPKVWAIRTKGWVELRKGARPRPKTTVAQLQIERRLPDIMVWSERLSNYVTQKAETVKEKVQLKTTIYIGGTPFKYVPLRQFVKTGGSIRDGEVKAVPPLFAAVYLDIKPERRLKEAA